MPVPVKHKCPKCGGDTEERNDLCINCELEEMYKKESGVKNIPTKNNVEKLTENIDHCTLLLQGLPISKLRKRKQNVKNKQKIQQKLLNHKRAKQLEMDMDITDDFVGDDLLSKRREKRKIIDDNLVGVKKQKST
ncbi:unnamed protein product [Diabrotica balteata]|uniref:Uncharacterized protein n=1 Tax=Diabrotica balteata TaxID=107213 RepID=A0A9N9XEE7_DIABA|nr:unnamed protein product [Diabrotica balteata]